MIVMVHGRFQPFHRGHLQYVRDALKMAPNVLMVGITNPAGHGAPHASDAHRHNPESNPFTFLERYLMVDGSCRDLVESQDARLVVVPFDLDNPETWGTVPRDAMQVVSAIELWDHEKARRFKSYGFPVHLYEPTRLTSGTAVRDTLNRGGDIGGLVPDGTLRVIINRAPEV
jgi:nicotinamide-nucleotide adenylyltransferase